MGRFWSYFFNKTFRMSYWHLIEQLWTLRCGIVVIWKKSCFFHRTPNTGKLVKFYSLPSTFESYSQDLATGLSVCSEIANLLIQEHPCWHQDLVNSQRRDPHLYSVRDIVFICLLSNVFEHLTRPCQKAQAPFHRAMAGHPSPTWHVIQPRVCLRA